MAYAAETGHVPQTAGMLMLANLFWTIAYDTEYAMVDREDDRLLGIHSSALLFGQWDVTAVMACYGIALLLLYQVGQSAQLGLAYNLGLSAAMVVAGYHYLLIRTRERDHCFRAFLHNNWFGGAVFAGLAVDYWWG